MCSHVYMYDATLHNTVCKHVHLVHMSICEKGTEEDKVTEENEEHTLDEDLVVHELNEQTMGNWNHIQSLPLFTSCICC